MKLSCPPSLIILFSPIVRHAISRVIAAIAEIELSASTWPALLPWLNQTTSSPNVVHREIGIYVLFTSLEAIIDATPTSIMQFIQHLSTLIQDPASLEVRSTSLRSVRKSITFILCLTPRRRSLGIVSQYIETTNKSEIVCLIFLIIAAGTICADDQPKRLYFKLLFPLWLLSSEVPLRRMLQILFAMGSMFSRPSSF